MPVSTNHLPQGLLKELFDYDPFDGRLIWKVQLSSSAPIGSVAGWSSRNGSGGNSYIYIGIGGRSYSAHILIWIWMTGHPPAVEIDHENRDGIDNRWKNLREATRAQNQTNTGIYKNNKSGYRGVYWDEYSGRWKAMLSVGGRNRHVGYFERVEDAAAAWMAAAERERGNFAQPKCVARLT